ncbi:MAG TPA: RNA chaperone ProQ, partial [Candidatus Anaerobiospirillum pullistercoris]|nr:RNA chaperone ProQ [Candidatus Anaerobiospirillum pullistercoris]
AHEAGADNTATASAAKVATAAAEGAEVKKSNNAKDKDAAMAAAIAAQQAITGTHQEHIQEALELLYKHFPKAFIKEGDCKPLKVGILEDLKPRISDIEGLSVSKVRAAVRFYTSRLRYFYAMREGAMRIDLDGNEIEPVSAEHAEYARTRFSEINAKRRPAKAKRNAKGKNQRRPRAGGEGQGQGQRNAGGNNFNNRRPNQGQAQGQNRRPNNGAQRRYEPAKISDLKPGRFVSVKVDRAFMRGTVVEAPQGDTVKLDMSNGMSTSMPISRVFVSVVPRGGEGGKRPFDRNRGPRVGNGGPRNGNNRGPRANNTHGPKADDAK